MRDFFRSPLFRCLVCLILVCCILVNVSPIRAKAFGGLSSAALIYLLYAAAAGAVIIPSSITIANAIGKKVDEEVEVSFDPILIDWWNQLTNYQDDLVPEWDPNEWNDILKHGLAGGLLALISSMMVDLVVQGAIDIVGDDSETGMAYYNNWYLPVLPGLKYPGLWGDSPIYSYIDYLPDSETFVLVYFSNVRTVVSSSGTYTLYLKDSRREQFNYTLSDSSWVFTDRSSSSNAGQRIYSMVWSDNDLYLDDGSLFIAGSEPSSTQTITIEPDIYVGDLPDEIRDGEKDEENLNLPIIDPFKIIKSPETAYEDVTQTLQDLKDGVITYDEYMEMVTADEPTVDPDPSDPTDPSEDPEDIPEEIAPYTFDLRKIFPFCIPFDLYDFLTCLNAEPVAPVIHWEIQLPGGGVHPLDLDLSPFSSVAQLLRRLQLLAFCIALGIKTRDLIKG